MANEQDLELLDDYLANRIHGAERSDFEQKLQADPDLQSEFALQKNLLDGIRNARVAELKSMLNNVPVPSGTHGRAITSKVVLGALAVLLAGATYWFVSRDRMPAAQEHIKAPAVEKIPSPDENIKKEEPAKVERVKPEVKTPQALAEKKPAKRPSLETDKNQTSAGTEHSKPSLAKKPDPVRAPVERSERNSTGDALAGEAVDFQPADAALVVETRARNADYSFHYQFADGKLLLYGPFEAGSYELIARAGAEKSALFLYYQGGYYLLNRENSSVTALTPVTNPVLQKKLNDYRNTK